MNKQQINKRNEAAGKYDTQEANEGNGELMWSLHTSEFTLHCPIGFGEAEMVSVNLSYQNVI